MIHGFFSFVLCIDFQILQGEVAVLMRGHSLENGTFWQDLRCARRNFFCSLLSILNSLLKVSGVQVPYSAHLMPGAWIIEVVK